jgi:hypothetical protein
LVSVSRKSGHPTSKKALKARPCCFNEPLAMGYPNRRGEQSMRVRLDIDDMMQWGLQARHSRDWLKMKNREATREAAMRRSLRAGGGSDCAFPRKEKAPRQLTKLERMTNR